MSNTDVPTLLKSSPLWQALCSLADIYKRIDHAQTNWISATPWHCPEGCGTCCEHFEPDVLEIEALYLAAWLLDNKTDEEIQDVLTINSTLAGCILRLNEGPWRCSVYGGRPLICRLFAFSGDRDKEGQVRFRPCAELFRPESGLQAHHVYTEKEILLLFGQLPPVMNDLARQAVSIFPSSTETLPLRIALPRALSKILMLKKYANILTFPLEPSDNPDGTTPPLNNAS